MATIGIVGDIHGEVKALERLLVHTGGIDHLVFVGDYVNRGHASAAVIDRLVRLGVERSCTFLEGNHDRAMPDALDRNRLDAVLQMGGAATVRSYLDPPFGDVAAQFRATVPASHVDFLRSLDSSFQAEGLLVAHSPAELATLRDGRAMFGVCGHVPQFGNQPTITADTARIDTGCGTVDGGLLTCLCWPSLDWFQA